MKPIYRTSKETQLRKDQKKRHILMIASEIFVQQGYANTAIKHVIEQAGISTGTFYFYFKSKEELFAQIYDAFIQLHEEVCNYANQNVRNIIDGFCRNKVAELWLFQKYKQLAKIMMIEAAGLNPVFEKKRTEFYRRSNERVEKIFDLIKPNGFLDSYDNKTAALLCNGTLYNVIVEWLQEGAAGNVLDYSLPIIIYNLNAFNIIYQKSELDEYSAKMISDMEQIDTSIFKEVAR